MGSSKLRERRRTCYWEETYAPELVGALAEGGWDFDHDRGPTKKFFDASSLTDHLRAGGARVFRKVVFTDCDFQGNFYYESQIVFDHCEFYNCDLSLSTWENLKFSGCTFENISLGQAVIKNCEFRSCKWSKVALSPNGTEMFSTYFSNPSAFISAASTNLDSDVLKEHKKDPLVQRLRLENTKATIARRILKMLQQEGGEDAFYDSVRTFLLQNATSEMAAASLKKLEARKFRTRALCNVQWFGWAMEREIIRAFGCINRWGASVVRPIAFMVGSFCLFSLIYEMIAPGSAFGPIQRSFDITILAGYSSYANEENPVVGIMQSLQVILSIVFYTLFFATVVNRVSRVR